MPDRTEQISKRLKTALRIETQAKRNLNSAVSLGTQATYAKNYVEAHMDVKQLRTMLINELNLPQKKDGEVMGEETDG